MNTLRGSLSTLLACLALSGCGEPESAPPSVAGDAAGDAADDLAAHAAGGSGGDAERGRLLLRQYGCGACHRIPGVADADGNVGPSLERIAKRVYLAGMLPNSPQNMVRWILAPQKIDPLTGMPDLQVTEAYAQDMTAYLYTLE